MRYGYARVSTDDQEHSLQLNALVNAGVAEENIIQETISGASNPHSRPKLSRLLADLCPGDELIVWRLDRLGRSAIDLLNIDKALKTHKVKLLSLTEGIDTSTPAGEFYYGILASMAQMERAVIVERVNAGIAAAKLKGRKFGRPLKLTENVVRQIHTLRKSEESVDAIAKAFGMTTRSVYRALAVTPVDGQPVSPETRL